MRSLSRRAAPPVVQWLLICATFLPSSVAAAERKPSVPKPAAGDKSKPRKAIPSADEEGSSTADAPPVKLPTEVFSTGYDGQHSELLSFINSQIRQGWIDNNVAPSSPADDAEWVRRVHLDLVGHIPDLEIVQRFVADKDKTKRAKLIETLLEDPAYARSLATIWANLLIGRATPRNIDRPALQKFLRQSFHQNRGWNEIVTDLLTAEGKSNENGETNFLLSQLTDNGSDEGVPATAISARLFLGMQVQCTQCHNHPFNEWKQNTFWELNSFFRQADRDPVRKFNEKTGRNEVQYFELTSKDFEGPVYFDRRSGLKEVAYPRFNGVDVEPSGSIDRRKELVRLIFDGDRTFVADAMVNRMWGHFFGYGFTRPVDDMGPHNQPSHPELLERLSGEFLRSKYDLKSLVRWICNSEAYNLTSRFNPKNKPDDPAAGHMPLFSHMYLKSMQAEQLYDSLLIATGAHKAGGEGWEKSEDRRQEWMSQFVRTFGTDENDESTSFDGTIPQALMLMNGDLMQTALSGEKGSVLYQVLHEKATPVEKLKLLYLATLSRPPSSHEIQAAQRILKGAKNPTEAYQDLFWALLNSNEFILNH